MFKWFWTIFSLGAPDFKYQKISGMLMILVYVATTWAEAAQLSQTPQVQVLWGPLILKDTTYKVRFRGVTLDLIFRLETR